MSDGKQDEELDVQSGKASAVIRALNPPFSRLKTGAVEKGKTLNV